MQDVELKAIIAAIILSGDRSPTQSASIQGALKAAKELIAAAGKRDP
jgi:hypothetical protein